MIVSQSTIARVTSGRQRKLWLPVERGAHGELLPCPLQPNSEASLQPAPFVTGEPITADDVTRRALSSMVEPDARKLGMTLHLALTEWEREHGINPAQEVWEISFTMGHHAAKRAEVGSRFLNRSLAGGHDYTADPDKALPGAGEALTAGELKLLGAASERRQALRDAEDQARVERLPLDRRIARVEQVARERGLDLSSEIRLIRQRVITAEQAARKSVTADR